jgi:putative ABC transport system permease protein
MNWIKQLFSRQRLYGDLSDEIQEHLAEKVDELVAGGMPREEATFAAQREFGNVLQIEERSREVWQWPALENFFIDVRYGARMLRKNSGFTAVAVVTLALGIGANTAMFSVVNTVILHPLPYKNSDQLVQVFSTKGMWKKVLLSRPTLAEVRSQNRVFQQVATFLSAVVTLTGTGEPERLQAAWVSPDLFPLLQVPPAVGRTFLPEEERPGRCQVAVISHKLWQRRFGSDGSVLGKPITLDGKPYTVVGVMPPGFRFPSNSPDAWLPRVLSGDDWKPTLRALRVIARLKEGVDLRQAQAQMDTLAARLEQEYPASDKGWGLELLSFREFVPANTRLSLLILLGAVGFVLLIACANVAHLSLARGAAQRREIAVRRALGASRSRIIRQLLTENLALALVSGAIGLIVALAGITLLRALAPKDIPRLTEVSVDQWVLGFTLGASFLSCILFGLVPAFHISNSDLNTSLKEGAQTRFTSSWPYRTRNLLFISEVALALVLLIGAGLMVQSFAKLVKVDPGFDPHHVLTMGFSLPENKYPGMTERGAAFVEEVLEHVRALPGVKSAAVVSEILLGGFNSTTFTIAGHPIPPSEPMPNAVIRFVSPSYFQTLSIPLIRGRDFTVADNLHSPCVAIINQVAAQRFWPNADPLGTSINTGWRLPTTLCEIAGLTGNNRDLQLGAEPKPEIYLPFGQQPRTDFFLTVRTQSNPLDLADAVRRQVWAVDKDQPIADVMTMDAVVSASLTEQRLHTLLLGSFAVAALGIALVGIFGLMSYMVTERTHEICIRVALGAQREDVLALVVGQGLGLTVVGVGIGLASAYALTRFLSSMLFAVRPTDPATFVGISLLLTGMALLASYVPARRATKMDPIMALKNE